MFEQNSARKHLYSFLCFSNKILIGFHYFSVCLTNLKILIGTSTV